MKIYEVVYDNGMDYEDHQVWTWYYETLEEAEVKYEAHKNKDELYWDDEDSITINLLELGTQKREVIKHEKCHQSAYEARMRECEETEAWLAERQKSREAEMVEMPSIPQTTLADIDALVALRDKLAGK